MEGKDMTADLLFQITNPVALIGWIVLSAAIIFKKPIWRDVIAGQAWPTALSFLYLVLIMFFWDKAEGGFDTLANVQKLFTSPWAALAGWVHYLAFDLFVGSHIARRVMEEGLPRLTLVVLLPLAFMFGPIGYLGFHIVRLAFARVSAAS
jgi:Domain of unknown function (DUF4281)